MGQPETERSFPFFPYSMLLTPAAKQITSVALPLTLVQTPPFFCGS
jgi:hypothetical protein